MTDGARGTEIESNRYRGGAEGFACGKGRQDGAIPFSGGYVFLSILGISARTVQRKTRSAVRLSPAASDRLSRMARILSLATEVFGAEEKAVE